MKNDEQQQRRDHWRKIVVEYLDSDMTQKDFCEKHNLKIPQLVYYYSRFRRENEPPIAKPSFVPVKLALPEKSVVTSEIKLSLPNGFQCVFPSHTDAPQIKKLLEVLLSC